MPGPHRTRSVVIRGSELEPLEPSCGAGVASGAVLAQLFLGDNLLAWALLALGGALACGNAMALLRPPRQPREGELTRAPVGRSLFMGALGLIAAIWALATLSR